MDFTAQPCRQPTVLLVEDDEQVRDVYTRLLVNEGFLVLTAPTAHDAIGILRTPHSPLDLVLLDIGLPDVRGTDLCARLRELFPHLPVLVCTGDVLPEDTARLLGLNITHIFVKPVNLNELVAAARAVLPDEGWLNARGPAHPSALIQATPRSGNTNHAKDTTG